MNGNQKIRSYCAQCQSACPIICHVESGKLTKISQDKDHPNTCSLCPKGLAGPELVYSPQRLKYPLKRTRAKDESDAGWVRISWDEALDTITHKLMDIKQTDGAQAVVFNRPGPGGSPSKDYAQWVVRLAYCFGSPNTLATGHVCQWHRDTGSKYTYGWNKVPEADYANTALLLIWGHNPYNSVRCNVRDIQTATSRGAKLIVIDPRLTPAAKKANLWLQIRPGTDGALMLGLIHLLIKTRAYDEQFTQKWTNAPFLVRSDTGSLLNAEELGKSVSADGFLVWDNVQDDLAVYSPEQAAYDRPGVDPKLLGSFTVSLSNGKKIEVRPVFDHLRELAAPYTPAKTESITGVPSNKIKKFAEHLSRIKPASYYTYNGLEQHTNAMQTNRALCILYAITGNLDTPGGNVFFPSIPGLKVQDPDLLPSEMHQLRINYNQKPLGPAGRPNSSVQAYAVFDSMLTGKPYPIKALVAFGGNIITANSNSLIARKALTQLKFCVQADLFMTPATELADIVLPASTFYESFQLKMGFPNLMNARQWIQYRPRVIEPLYETRSDMEMIFDLAHRLGLGNKFWDGDIEKAFNDQLKSSGLDLGKLKKNPGGLGIDLPITYRKYSTTNPETGVLKGFETPSGRIEIFSQRFKEFGYNPLPDYQEPEVSPLSKPEWQKEYPLILTCSKLLYFCHGQHRAIPSLRKAVPHPYIEINSEKAQQLNIKNGEWVFVETPHGKIRVMAKLTDGIDRDVVCVQHGWWQACDELNLPGYDPFSTNGANANLLYSTEYTDKISGSVPYKAYLCKVSKAEQQEGDYENTDMYWRKK